MTLCSYMLHLLRGDIRHLCIPHALFSDDSHRMSITQIWPNYNFSDDCLLSNMVHAILDTNILFTKIVSAFVKHCNSEIANLHCALAALQQLLERHPTSSMLCCDLQQVKSSLREKQEARSMFFYYRNVARPLLVGRKGRTGPIRIFSISLNEKLDHFLLLL